MTRHITRRRAAIATPFIVVLIWLLWPANQLARVQALQRELFSEAGRNLTPEQRQEKFRQLRTATEKLSTGERAQLASAGQKRMEEQMSRYFQMTPKEKQTYLDQQIDRELTMQQQKGKAGPPQGVAGGGGGPPSSRGPQTPESRENRRKQHLDATTPEFRAQFDQFRKELDQRRQQRGLPPSTGRGR